MRINIVLALICCCLCNVSLCATTIKHDRLHQIIKANAEVANRHNRAIVVLCGETYRPTSEIKSHEIGPAVAGVWNSGGEMKNKLEKELFEFYGFYLLPYFIHIDHLKGITQGISALPPAFTELFNARESFCFSIVSPNTLLGFKEEVQNLPKRDEYEKFFQSLPLPHYPHPAYQETCCSHEEDFVPDFRVCSLDKRTPDKVLMPFFEVDLL
jgi:hypothetical protein